MLRQSIDRLNAGLASIKSHLAANESMREILSEISENLEPSRLEYDLSHLKSISPSTPQWRVVDHCSAVSRMYALFEQFVEGILAEWISFRSKGITFQELPEAMISSYAEGFSSLLSMLSQDRFSNISRERVVEQYHIALSGQLNFQLQVECLLLHQNNIRNGELLALAAKCGILNLNEWISNSKPLMNHFQAHRKIAEQTSSKLKNLVNYRNEASHGAVAIEEILGFDELVDASEFFSCLSETIFQYVNFEALNYLLSKNIASHVGMITEVFSNDRYVASLEGVLIEEKGYVYCITDKSYHKARIESIQLGGLQTTKVQVATPLEVGLRFDIPVPKRAKVVVLK